jgi:protein arginine kinase
VGHLSLARNLADFPFAPRCTPDERRQVSQRMLAAFEQLDLLASGTWYPFADLAAQDRHLLIERRLLIPSPELDLEGRGVYISHDQSLAIMVNCEDHLRLRLLTAGVDPAPAWERLSRLDDQLTALLDFAYDEDIGFVTRSLEHLGTGLEAGLLLHLPCLRDAGKLEAAAENIHKQRFLLLGAKTGAGDACMQPAQAQRVPQRVRMEREALAESLCADMRGAVAGHARESCGNLYLLVNARTLGMAEAEIVFHMRTLASDLIQEERAACETLLAAAPASVEDRIGRARGIAGGAHLLGFDEGLDVLSALRLGVSAGRPSPGELKTLNSLLIRTQRAHLTTALSQEEVSPLALNAERARLFRARFGPGTQN